MQSSELIWSVNNAIGTIILNRPEFHNAITKHMWMDIPVVMNALKMDGAKVIIFSGTGTSFSAGADINELKKLDSREAVTSYWLSMSSCLKEIMKLDLPTMAMINGPCLGGGLLLASSCDLRFASNLATFGIPVARLGIVLDDTSISRLIEIIGPAYTSELLFTGSTIYSARAESMGFINQLMENDKLESYVNETAHIIASNALDTLAEAKESICRCLNTLETKNKKQVINSYLGSEFRKRVVLFGI